MHSYYKNIFHALKWKKSSHVNQIHPVIKVWWPLSLSFQNRNPLRHTDKILCCLTKAGVKSGAYQGGCSPSLASHSLGKASACDILSWNSLCWKSLRHEISWRSKPSLLFSELVNRDSSKRNICWEMEAGHTPEKPDKGAKPLQRWIFLVCSSWIGRRLSFILLPLSAYPILKQSISPPTH